MRWRKGKQRELDLGSLEMDRNEVRFAFDPAEVSFPQKPIKDLMFVSIPDGPPAIPEPKMPIAKTAPVERFFKKEVPLEDAVEGWESFIQKYMAAYRVREQLNCRHFFRMWRLSDDVFMKAALSSTYVFQCEKCGAICDMPRDVFWGEI